MNVINLFDEDNKPKDITRQDILDFVEYCNHLPVKENPENMDKFYRCLKLIQELVPMLDDAMVLPIISVPTFHHSITAQIVCKRAHFEGESLELLREIVSECNVFGFNITTGERIFRIEIGVSNAWEVLKNE